MKIIVSQPGTAELIRRVSTADLDLAILTRPAALPANVTLTHTMTDPFSILTASSSAAPPSPSLRDFRAWAVSQSWLLPPQSSRSRELIDHWAHAQKIHLQPAMELENFDLMIQLASMGMGAAFIPRRSLASFPRKRLVRLVPPPVDLSRELIVVSPSHSAAPEHLTRFVAGILFS